MKRIALVLCLGLLSLGAGKRAATGPQYLLFGEALDGLYSVSVPGGQVTHISKDRTLAKIAEPNYDAMGRGLYSQGPTVDRFYTLDPYTGKRSGPYPVSFSYKAPKAPGGLTALVYSPKTPGVVYGVLTSAKGESPAWWAPVRVDLYHGQPIVWGSTWSLVPGSTFTACYDIYTDTILWAVTTPTEWTGFVNINPYNGGVAVLDDYWFANRQGPVTCMAVDPVSGDLFFGPGPLSRIKRASYHPPQTVPTTSLGFGSLNFLPVIGATKP